MSHDDFEGLTQEATAIALAGETECRAQLPKILDKSSAPSGAVRVNSGNCSIAVNGSAYGQQRQLQRAVRPKTMMVPPTGRRGASQCGLLISCSFSFAAGLALIAFQAGATAADTKIDTGQCSIAVAGSAVGNSITCNFGLTPDQLRQLTEAAVRGVTEAQQERVDKVSKALGVTEDAAKNLLRVVGEDPNVPEDKLAEALTKAGNDYRKLEAQVAALNPENPIASGLVLQAKPEIEAGHFERAHELLREATQAQIAAAHEAGKVRKQAQAAEDAQWLGAASSTAAEGGVALTERKFDRAATLFGQAADYVPSGRRKERGDYLLRRVNALYRQGGERGDNDALREAIEVCRTALAEFPRSETPLQWANAQAVLGNVLQTLGGRESAKARLEDAVSAYRAALEELTRERLPIAWAITQNNLGAALMALGEREGGPAELERRRRPSARRCPSLTRDRRRSTGRRRRTIWGPCSRRWAIAEPGRWSSTTLSAYRAALEE